jgi:hypothetical protein
MLLASLITPSVLSLAPVKGKVLSFHFHGYKSNFINIYCAVCAWETLAALSLKETPLLVQFHGVLLALLAHPMFLLVSQATALGSPPLLDSKSIVLV